LTTIYRQSADSLSVADAKRLIALALPREPAVRLWKSPSEQIEPEWLDDGGFSLARIDATFSGACAELNITPRHRYEPTRKDYIGPGLQDAIYTVTHEEFSRFAGLYGMMIEIAAGEASPPATQAEIRHHRDDIAKCDELAPLAAPAYVRIKSPEYIRLREMLIDWDAYRFRDSFTLYEVACLLNRMDPRAVLDEAHRAIRMRGGVAADVLNNPAATVEMLHLNPADFYAPPVGYALVRLKRAAGSKLGVFVKAERLPALADMLGNPYPPELERETTAPATAKIAPTEAPEKKRERLLNWWDVAGSFMVETLRAGQYATAKELDAALRAGAGAPESPFDKGEGQNRHSLFVRDIAQPLMLKTIQNNWQKLRNAAKN